MSDLVAQDIHKHFQLGHETIEILRGIDLHVGPGESIAVLGVSGAGKTTLLNVLGGLEPPSSGRLLFGGVDVADMSAAERAHFRGRSVGFVFQLHHLLPEFDAQENVMMPALIAGCARAEARDKAAALLEAVGLAERRGHSPGKLSGGERQRVAIARAMVLSPDVILADEPTGNLDPHTAGEVEDLFLGLVQEASTALVLVTHNEKLATRLSKKSYLVEGRLES